jgi:hypothetical protein
MYARQIILLSTVAVLVAGLPMNQATRADIAIRDTITVPVGSVDPRTGKKATEETTFEVEGEVVAPENDQSLKNPGQIINAEDLVAANVATQDVAAADTENPTPEELEGHDFITIPAGSVNPKTGKVVDKETIVIDDGELVPPERDQSLKNPGCIINAEDVN